MKLNFSCFSWLLLTWCSLALFSCTNPAENLTDGAISAVLKRQDSLTALSRAITQTAATTGTAIISDGVLSLAQKLKDKADTVVERSATRLDSSVARAFAGADKTVQHALSNTAQELRNPANLRFLAQARDTVLGKPTQDHVQALVRVAFQEFRKQQDSTLKALEGRSESWQTRLQDLAAPILAMLGALALVAILIIAILRLILFIKQRRQHEHE